MGRQRAERLYPSDLTNEEHVWSATARLRAVAIELVHHPEQTARRRPAPMQSRCGSEVRILERNLEACERVTLNLGRCNARYSRPVAMHRVLMRKY
jgi:hypothetical protein